MKMLASTLTLIFISAAATVHGGEFVPLLGKSLSLSPLTSVAYEPQPTAALSVNAVLESKTEFSIFTNALKKSGLWDRIAAEDAVTLFVVPDKAMKDEGSAFLLEKVLVTKSNKERLFDLMSFHSLFGVRLSPDEIEREAKLNTSANSCLPVYRLGSGIRVGPEAVVTEYLFAENGVIFVIDRLLWQPWQDDGPCGEIL